MPADAQVAVVPVRPGRALAAGDMVAGRYRIVRALGRGSFGRTFLAVDTAAGEREVAVKQLYAEGERGWKAFELFEREAAALRSLRHHGIPEVFEHLRETDDGGVTAYLVMEYVEGASLEQRLAEGAGLEPAALLRLALGLLDILEYLHSRVPPVLHRDIKPANVILRPDGAPALVDFGAVRTVFRTAEEGGSTVVGTFGYMPFEQYMGQASPASDLYAVGATLLHVVTGRAPAEFATRDGAVEVPKDLPGGPVLRAVVTRLLAPSASARFQSAREVRDALLAPTLAGAEPSPTTALVRVESSLALTPAPRAIEGALKTRFDHVSLTPMKMVFTHQKPSQSLSASWMFLGVMLGMLTFGIVPLVYWVWHHNRKERLRKFFEAGVPATGKILQIHKDSLEWFEVAYEFTLDGVTRRGLDTVFPAVGRMWQRGDVVELLVLPEGSYESVIISDV